MARKTLDLGRYSYKAAQANHQTLTEIAGLAHLSNEQYEKALLRENNIGLVRWNNQFFAIGEQSESFAAKQDATTANRYHRDNIGIVAASMVTRMLQAFGGGTEYEGDLVISHPPLDIEYLPDLREAVIGDWLINAGGVDYRLYFERIITLDEPIAILMNTLLNVDGVSYRNKPTGSILVIDLGGVTADISVLGENGKLSLGYVDSDTIGINEQVMAFYDAIRKRHAKQFKNVYRPNRALIQKAFATGVFDGGKTLDCLEEATRFKQIYLNRLMQWLQTRTGGLLNYHTLVFGGGGSALMQRELVQAIEHDNIIFADESSQIHTAGVRGMIKYAKVLEATGKI